MSWDPAELREAWFEGKDPQRAVSRAGLFLDGVSAGEIDPVANVSYFERAVEVFGDGEGGSAARAMACVRDVQPLFLRAELGHGLAEGVRLYYRARPWLLLAQAQHRDPKSYQDAFDSANGLLTWITDVAGGVHALCEILRRPTRSDIGEIAVAALAIYIATLRRRLPPGRVRSQYFDHALAFVRAYLSNDDPVIYPGTPALAAQWLYALVERGAPEDDALIEIVYELDVDTRPRDSRGIATTSLRDYVYAVHCGDFVEAERLRQIVIAALAAFPLPRHQRTVEEQRYLAA
jgi:hypothetical protein